ncbi:MAG: SAM-dependent chlorinase/fluorinase [Deltaproteobacteria bacterium]|nr:SAM-dependent chlorinase/fluorinase [Deltaproteobacteria bacterium]
MSRIITLTTDFGYQDPFVGIMKGVVCAIDPEATIVDLTHGVAPQDVTGGALALAATVDFFPAGTIHAAVVDPGVGGERRPILVETDRACYIGPDNGLLSLAAGRQRLIRVVHLSNPDYHLSPTSTTFHGRDIFAPAAAHVSAGVPPEKLGETVEAFETLNIPAPETPDGGRIAGEVIYVDGFGNLTTNIRGEDLERFDPESIAVRIGDREIRGISANYASAGTGNYLALVNSWGLLEVSRCNGSAQAGLGAGTGTRVLLAPPSSTGSPPPVRVGGKVSRE